MFGTGQRWRVIVPPLVSVFSVRKLHNLLFLIHPFTNSVRLVREYYGFDDEDEAEIARVKGVSSLHTKGTVQL